LELQPSADNRQTRRNDKCLNSVKTKESAFDFNTVIPEPENNPDWFTWRFERWGTKWNARPSSGDTIVAEKIPIGAEMWFDTAWGPPLPVVLELSKKFPELEFQLYFVIEDNGEGSARFKNGETLCNDYADFESVDSLLSHETPP
jgi:Ferredoxin-like domain in Api92-like protein